MRIGISLSNFKTNNKMSMIKIVWNYPIRKQRARMSKIDPSMYGNLEHDKSSLSN